MTSAFLVGQGLGEGEDALLNDPERLVELAARFGTQVLGDYPA